MGFLDPVPVKSLTSKAKALFYGPAGTRKTTFAKDAPGPILWWDFERGADSLKFYEGTENIDIIRVNRNNPNHTAKLVLDSMVASLKDQKYQTLVIDTVDRMHSFFLKAHMQMVETEKKTLVGDSLPMSRTRHLPQFQDHNLITNYLDDFFELAQACDKNVVFISHEVEQFDPPASDGSRKFRGIRPGLTPSLSKKLQELINVVAFFSVGSDLSGKTDILRIQVAPTREPIIAKNRLGIAKAVHDNPTWESLFGK